MEASHSVAQIKPLSVLESGIVRTLLYFGVFRYPLKAREIWENLGCSSESMDELVKVLQQMVKDGLIQSRDGYFWVNGPDEIARRQKGNSLANQTMPKAHRWSKFIAKFPYVRGVMLSGSLSKGYMEEGSDIDYFIVTEPGRLWVARTVLILYKKLFLLNSHKEFCVNYFVDLDHLAIEDRNVFTATETQFLIPTINPSVYHQFREHNAWAKEFFPQSPSRLENICKPYAGSRMGRMLEWVLGGKLGEKLDLWCMKKTLNHWKKKFGHFEDDQFELALRSRKYVSKHHPSDFQGRVLNRLREQSAEFESRFGVKLS